jgi:hypothetical protein
MSLSSFGLRGVALLCLMAAISVLPGCFHDPPGTVVNTGGTTGSGAGAGQATGGNGATSGTVGSGAGAGGISGADPGAGAGGISGAGSDSGAGGISGSAGAAAGSGSGSAGQSGQGGAGAGSAGTSAGGMSGAGAAGGPALVVCGGKYCGADEYCCNPSCATCAPRGQGCLADECDRMRCGRLLCPAGSSCCSAACGECGSACGVITTCEPNCAPMQAQFQGDSSRSLGWFWNGTACIDQYARSCSGADCDDGFTTQAECEASFAACLE